MNKEITNIRKNIIEMVYQAASGHIGGSLSAVELLTVLYFEVMNINPENITCDKRDRFVLSKGHASPLLYSVLTEKGILNEDLSTFRQVNSKLQGHPNMNLVPGVEMSTGSLGQGLSTAVGMAKSFKIDGKPNKVYALVGDGEIQEGQIWEALMAAAHYQLDNLTVIIDNNNLQIDGDISEVMSPYPLDAKLAAFNFDVQVIDGHDIAEIKKAYLKPSTKPKAIIAKTIKGKGISFMENNAGWHGVAPSQAEYEQAMQELGVK